MGPFMVEIVFCRVTRRGRKKGKGMNKGLRGNMRNDGPAMSFVPPDDTIKITLDLRSATILCTLTSATRFPCSLLICLEGKPSALKWGNN